jgi:hypothetical protein
LAVAVEGIKGAKEAVDQNFQIKQSLAQVADLLLIVALLIF